MTVNRCPVPYQPDSIACYEHLRNTSTVGFLLDSGHQYPGHDTDIMGFSPTHQETLHHPTSAAEFNALMSRVTTSLEHHAVQSPWEHPLPGWYGLWSYDLGAITEAVELAIRDNDRPLCWMGFFPVILLTRHRQQETLIVYLDGHQAQANQLKHQLTNEPLAAKPTHSLDLPPLQSDWTFQQYQQQFDKISAYITEGDCYQVNLAQRFVANAEVSPWQIYRQLRSQASSPMGGYLEVADWALLSLSPERFIQCVEQQVTTKPIKGTRPRHQDARQDQQAILELQQSLKDRAENLMIVDLLRNDLGKFCITGTVQVETLFSVESFANVHHLVSTVTGQLPQQQAPLTLLASAFPGGSITGAPKRRVMEIINELESHNRSFYCGSLLYSDVAGRMDSNILIRSLSASKGQLECWSGGGIVADSTAEAEYQESLDKVNNFIKIFSQETEL